MYTSTAETLLHRILMFFSICITAASLGVPFLYAKITPAGTFIAIFVLLIIAVVLKYLSFLDDRKRRIILGVTTLLHGVLLLYIAYTVRLRPDVDLSHIIHETEKMTADHSSLITDEYFAINPNNLPLMILIYRVYTAVCSLFGHTVSLEVTGGIMNVLLIEITILCLYRLIDRITDDTDAAWMTKWIILLNPVWIAYASYYYTDTVSLPFAAAGLLLFVDMLRENSTGRKTLLCILSGILLFTAMKIRVTYVLLILSVLIALLYRRRFRELLRTALVFALSFLLVQAVYQRIEDMHFRMDTYDTALPPTHFMMMGSHGSGQYSLDDVYYTTSFPTHEEKVQNTWNTYLDHLKHNGIKGNIILLVRKELVSWCNGMRGYDPYTAHVVQETPLYQVFYGNRSMWFHGLMQGYQILLFACIALGLRKYEAGKSDVLLSIMIFWCGTILFSMIWEAHTRHAVTYIPFLTMLCIPAFKSRINDPARS